MLQRTIGRIAREAGAEAAAAAFYDYETATAWSYHGDRWFHAASTIKVGILAGLYDAVEAQRFTPDDRLHVRNRFLSAVGGEPFRVSAERDANGSVYAALGKLMKLRTLALHMIATSSNLATNLLLELVGVEEARATLARHGLEGLDLVRGVEDERAWQADLNNRVTAQGLVRLFRLIVEERLISPEASSEMLEILKQQAFRSGIPAGLPEPVRNNAAFAHKTGEMSRVTHDAGVVFLPDRKPYVVAVLTEWDPGASGRRETVAQISGAIYEHLTATAADPAADDD